MATFVDLLPEKELVSVLAEFLHRLEKKGKTQTEETKAEGGSTIEGKEPVEIVRFFLNHVSLLFKEASEKEVENFFFAVFNLIKKLDHESGKKVTEEAVDKLVSTQPLSDRSSTRIKLLVHLYNIFEEDPTARGGYFLALLQYSNLSHHAEVLIPQFKDIDRRITEWGLTKKEKQTLYKHVRNTYRNASRGKEAYEWSVKWMGLYENENEIGSEEIEEGYNTILEGIRIPTVYRYHDLINLIPVKKLQESGNDLHKKAYELLDIYLHQDVNRYMQLIKKNESLLKKLVLDEESVTEKIRILSIASLIGDNKDNNKENNNSISYSTICEKLSIEETRVEYYVILSMTQGIIEGRIDQMNRMVTITRRLQGAFTTKEWKDLSLQLSVWSNNVNLLLKTLSDCKQNAPQL